MIEYSRCDLAIFRAECGDIMEAHYAEIGQPLKLSIDWNLYAELDRLEKLVIIVARDLCNVVGYNIFIINRHPHYDAISATNDVLYVAREYRAKSIGRRLIKHAQTMFAAMGISVIYYHAKPINELGKLLEISGYKAVETTYAHYLKEAV